MTTYQVTKAVAGSNQEAMKGVPVFRYVSTVIVAILLSRPRGGNHAVSGQLSHANGSDERHQPLRPSRRQGSGRGAVAWLRRYG